MKGVCKMTSIPAVFLAQKGENNLIQTNKAIGSWEAQVCERLGLHANEPSFSGSETCSAGNTDDTHQ